MTGPRATEQQPIVRTIGQMEIVFDSECFLNDFNDWSEEINVVLAGESYLTEPAEKHWQVICFLREFYAGHGRTPLNSLLKKGTAMTLFELESIFPGGNKKGALRLAGLPNPKICD